MVWNLFDLLDRVVGLNGGLCLGRIFWGFGKGGCMGGFICLLKSR